MTSTILETYDAQMSDYPSDHDFSMQISSSDSWQQQEALMEGGEPVDVSIEVEMRSYEEEGDAEYEMVDGSEDPHFVSAELTDVEVYDASHVPSPTAVSHGVADAIPATVATDAIAEAVKAPSTDSDGIDSDPLYYERLGYAARDVDAASSASIYPLQFHEDERNTEVDAAAAAEEEEEEEDPHSVIRSGFSHENVEVAERVENEHAGEEHGSPSINSSPPLNPLQGDEAVSQGEEVQAPDISDGRDVNETGRTVCPAPESSVIADPHEISEGVYIDPPPPVLVSLSNSELTEISLFNTPSPAGPLLQSNGPVPSYQIMLSQLPTLYYEPLSSVFDALRQEELSTHIPDISESELVLDAYDLQLVITEDNIYTREVTLHDLNVLHDALNLSGPLRLRLYTNAPRFIVQYHVLQEQVAQISLEAPKPEENDRNTSERRDSSDETALHDHTVVENEELQDEAAEPGSSAEKITEPPDNTGENYFSAKESHGSEQHSEEQAGTVSGEQADEVIVAPTTVPESEVGHQTEHMLSTSCAEVFYEEPDAELSAATAPSKSERELVANANTKPVDESPDGELGTAMVSSSSERRLDVNSDRELVARAPDTAASELPHDESSRSTPLNTQLAEDEDTRNPSDADQGTAHAEEELDTVDGGPPYNVAHEDIYEGSHQSDDYAYAEADEFPQYGEDESGETSTHAEAEFLFVSENAVASGSVGSDILRLPALASEAVTPRSRLSPYTNRSVEHSNESGYPDALSGNPSGFDPESWVEDLDGEGDIDVTWDAEQESNSAKSSVTLSSRLSSKRSIDDLEETESYAPLPISPPDSKRPRIE